MGISHGFKQIVAVVVGGLAGIAAWVGATLLLHRRLLDPRIRRSSSIGDILVLILIWLQLTMGIGTTYWTMQHLNGEEMIRFMGWANALITFDPSAPALLSEAALIYKLHIVLGLTLFLITPFTRLVHIWSAPLGYMIRPGYQIVRSLAPLRRTPKGPLGGAPSAGGTTVMRQQSEEGQAGA
ncbi:Respiratory nitrate reductase gamma chain [Rubellimicrobium mesophilum DSM 19309]|uniref:Respiratory nitrate reductase gamma chain n=1 Tax=Rubellimicrobium mesophilum DSM 19309 TaxID=442562 RepID=A0A017HGE7_9RHOB|nr:respiratory nitrate reductase subunit gamma [Rubellimicrobium mesophilum]EYD72879.1 Respiratory nitrate reductase gamma chain [Rubellimicrobium mesophilum DSM 19309]